MDSPTVPSGTGMALPQNNPSAQNAGAGLDIISALTQQKLQSDVAISALMKQATTPVRGPALTPPQLAIPQSPRFQPQPLNEKDVVGHSNARRQGISNLIVAATNVVGQYEQKAKDEKQRVLAVDIERIYSAMDGIQQAKETLQNDPKNKEAQDVLKKNQDVVDALMSDPKRRQQLAKAFDINILDPSKNDKPEHAAMQTATKSYAEQLESKLPTQMKPNQQAMQQLQMELERNKQISENLDHNLRISELKTQNDIRQQHELEIEMKDRNSEDYKNRSLAARVQMKQDELRNRWAIATNSTNTRIKVAGIAASSHVQGVQMQVDGRLAVLDKIQNPPPAAVIKVYQKNLEDQQKLGAWLPQALNQAQQLYKSKAITEDEYKSISDPIKSQIEQNNKDIQETRSTIEVMSAMIASDSEDQNKNKKTPQVVAPKEGGNNGRPATNTKPASTTANSSKGKSGKIESPNAGDSDTNSDNID